MMVLNRSFCEYRDDAAIQCCFRVVRQLADQHAPGRALDESDDAMFIGAADGIHLPVADFKTRLDIGRSFGDVPFAGEPAPLVA